MMKSFWARVARSSFSVLILWTHFHCETCC
uniref:Uncharacterized protein n=1 Tax=Anguilla anguilla TaxID=7936 RepID=A0A0E9TXE2_ANGAN